MVVRQGLRAAPVALPSGKRVQAPAGVFGVQPLEDQTFVAKAPESVSDRSGRERCTFNQRLLGHLAVPGQHRMDELDRWRQEIDGYRSRQGGRDKNDLFLKACTRVCQSQLLTPGLARDKLGRSRRPVRHKKRARAFLSPRRGRSRGIARRSCPGGSRRSSFRRRRGGPRPGI
jgi:hypothetical protein